MVLARRNFTATYLRQALLIWGVSLASLAHGASLQVSPVVLNLEARQAADSLWLSNSGSTVLQAQVRIYSWEQEGGEDKLKPTRDLIASPPMLSVQPGQRQLVRIVRVGNGAAPPPSEKTYRVIMDELPVGGSGKGVQFVLRYSVPVFVSAQNKPDAEVKAPPPQVSWSLKRKGADLILVAVNTSAHHAKITEVSFTSKAAKKIVLSEGLYGYALGMNAREWPLTEHARVFAAGGTLDARINDQPVSVALPSLP